MAKYSTSQLKSQMRKAERQIKQDVNRATRQAEQQIKREMNRAVHQAENEMNREVRKLDTRLRQNQQKIEREYKRLITSGSVSSQYTISLQAMHRTYLTLDESYQTDQLSAGQQRLFELAEQELATGLTTANTLEDEQFLFEDNDDAEIGNQLANVSADLDQRWKGAVFALNPNNPDAPRQFCTSAREIFTEFIELKAPDSVVLKTKPDAEKTENGTVTRKEKIRYMIYRRGADEKLASFADEDVTNIFELFRILNNATHGKAGRYSHDQLKQIKKRVGRGILFLCSISS